MADSAPLTLSYAEDVWLNYDPEQPQPRFGTVSAKARSVGALASGLPHPILWPGDLAPTPKPLAPPPAEGDSLERFKEYDAIVMTYTSAEAAALAVMFTPGYPVRSWYEYRHNVAAYLPLVSGPRAPFNSNRPEDARYKHSLGLYFPLSIGKARVLAIKSGLHMDYDGLGNDGTVPFYKMVAK